MLPQPNLNPIFCFSEQSMSAIAKEFEFSVLKLVNVLETSMIIQMGQLLDCQ